MHGKLQGVIEMLRSDRERRQARPEPAGREQTEQLQQRLAELLRDHQRARETCAREEEQLTELCGLFVALERLHGTVERAEVLAALQEIVINLVGCEELALYAPAAVGGELRAELSFGVDASRLGLGAGSAARAVAGGRSFFAGDGPALPDGAGITACVPLRAGGVLVGVLVLWSLLRHKPGLSDRDRRLLDVLSTHAATALHLTRLAGAGAGAGALP
jgi:hypothetical protein